MLLLQGVFFLFAIIVVVAYHVILIVLWVAPMTTRMQKQFFLTAQVLNAWRPAYRPVGAGFTPPEHLYRYTYICYIRSIFYSYT